MKVWVVESGPGYEGGDDVQVFSTRELALDYAETARAAETRLGRWAEVHEREVDAPHGWSTTDLGLRALEELHR